MKALDRTAVRRRPLPPGLVALFALLLAGGSFSVQAQTPLDRISRVIQIRSVAVHIEGTAEPTAAEVRMLISSQEGEVYDEQRVDRDIRALYRTGWFRSIEVHRKDVSEAAVELIFMVQARPRIRAVRIDAERKLRRFDPNAEVTTKAGDRLFDHVLASDAARLTAFYQHAGYPNVVVTFDVTRDAKTGDVTVRFIVKKDGVGAP